MRSPRRYRSGPIEYVQTLGIEEAKHLLETTSTPIDGVAAAVGYRDPTSFRRVCARMTGVTPARFRDQSFVAPGLASQWRRQRCMPATGSRQGVTRDHCPR
ncbi:helix-turn-helix domain-containing protein [Arhodomonas sp. AD133]|uniref:helix-turn-helix domain-containing protein n=1 Tax=Arhodomonas sp. AD133 TaxID=3415009 RepID=UPI003EBEC7C4